MYCIYCGTKNPEDAVFCRGCGKRQTTTSSASTSNSLHFPQVSPPVVSYNSEPSHIEDISTVQSSQPLSSTSIEDASMFDIPSSKDQLTSTQGPPSSHSQEQQIHAEVGRPGGVLSLSTSVISEKKFTDKRKSPKFFSWQVLGPILIVIVLVGGSVAFYISSLSKPASSASMISVVDSPTPKPYAVVSLEYSTNMDQWGINYNRPSSVDLSDTPPDNSWILPPSRGMRRLFGAMKFGDNTLAKMVADETSVLEGGSNMNYIAMQVVFAFNDDKDFSNKPSISTTGGDLAQPFVFDVAYANNVHQPYAISVYTYVVHNSGSDRYVLSYYRACVRQGVAKLNGTDYPIAITAEGNDGIYSNLDFVDVTLDLNQDGKFEDNEHFPASKPFTLNGQTFVISSIAENGSTMNINRS